MGVLDRLFGPNSSNDSPEITLVSDPSEKEYVRGEIDGERALCGCAYSPDGEWLGVYTRSNPKRVALRGRDDPQTRYVRELDWPSDIAVANGGHVAVCDNHGASTGTGTFYVFDPDGDTVVEHPFETDLGESTISSDGRYAAVVTVHESDADSGTATGEVYVFEVETGSVLKRIDYDMAEPRLHFGDAGEHLELAGEDGVDTRSIPVDG